MNGTWPGDAFSTRISCNYAKSAGRCFLVSVDVCINDEAHNLNQMMNIEALSLWSRTEEAGKISCDDRKSCLERRLRRHCETRRLMSKKRIRRRRKTSKGRGRGAIKVGDAITWSRDNVHDTGRCIQPQRQCTLYCFLQLPSNVLGSVTCYEN